MKKNAVIGSVSALALGFLVTTGTAIACSRFTYEGAAGAYYVGRSMDWMEDIGTNLWSFPRGMARDGGVGPRSIKWTSKYGSVVATAYDIGTADGMNEAGLVANLLYLAESDYGDPATSGKPLISLGAWAQYALDNFGTVGEAVAALRQEPFTIVAAAAPNGKAGTVHLALTDAARRQRDPRVRRRQARHPPGPRLPGDDQLARLRPAARDQRVLEGSERPRRAAGHPPRRGPLRAPQLEPERRAPGSRPAPRHGHRLQPHPHRLRAARPQGPGEAEHRRHDLADRVRHRPAAVLLRFVLFTQRVLGGSWAS